ncbi:hypothetical protein [Streptomyces sp. NPDC059881]|uniref:hypothetical protein n=1 Tax=Streptomyces sp. NPDC059881 TaxID=3346986 RepID=UPI0036506116
MTTGAPPPHLRCTLLRAVVAAAALAVGAAGCADHDAGTAPRPAPSPRTTSPQQLCTTLVTRWAQQLLADGGSGYGDYQSMGLSNGQYEILRAVLDAARTEEQRNGPAIAHQLIERQADRRCTERYREGVPTGGPWQ